jgi:hypothetical protein
MVTLRRLRSSPEELRATARVLKAALHDPDTPARDLGPLARELRMTLGALEAARPAHKDDRLDEIAAKRKARLGPG